MTIKFYQDDLLNCKYVRDMIMDLYHVKVIHGPYSEYQFDVLILALFGIDNICTIFIHREIKNEKQSELVKQ